MPETQIEPTSVETSVETSVTYDPNKLNAGMDKLVTFEDLAGIGGTLSKFYDTKKVFRELVFPLNWERGGAGTGPTRGTTNRVVRIRTNDAEQSFIDWTFMLRRDYKLMDFGILWETPASTGNMDCELYIQGTKIGYASNYSSLSTTSTTFATGGANLVTYSSFIYPKRGVNFAALTSYDFISIELVRSGAVAGDTLNNQADIYGLLTIYT